MATLTFFTRSKKNPAPIRAYFSIAEDNIIYAKEIFTVAKEDWNNGKGALKKESVSMNEECKKLQDHLDNISTIVFQNFNRDGKNLPKDWLQKIVDRYKSSIGHNNETATAYATRIFEEYKAKTRPGLRGKMLAPDTAKTFLAQIKVLKKYEKEKNLTLHFNDITLDFYYDFRTWLVEEDKSPNSIYTAFRMIKQFMAEAKRDRLHQNLAYKDEEFRAVVEDADSIVLTLEEVHAWENLDLSRPDQEGLRKSRDLFLDGVYSAQRYRDYSNFKPEHIGKLGEMDVIRFYQHKTTNPVIFPLAPKFKKLLERYNNYSPARSITSYIKDLKILGKMAGITSIVLHKVTKGGETTITPTPKYELITSHTCRRTAATLMVKAGYPIVEAMKITGHKTISQFLKYVHITEEEIAVSINKREYFV